MIEKNKFKNPEQAVHNELALWAGNCAEHTLHLFEEKYPDDKRPRLAIVAIREWARGERTMVECREAAYGAHAAARSAKDAEAIVAARACGQACAVAHIYTPHAADYASKSVALSVPKDQSNEVRANERDWQWKHLREDLRIIGFPNGKGQNVKIKI